ncbi:MAG: outer membrane protein [Gammaproteobacteria bacterium]
MTCKFFCRLQSKQKLKWLTLFFISAFSVSSAFALTGHLYLGGTIGASRAEVGNSNPQINYYDGFLTDVYPIRENHITTAILGLNGGYEFVGTGYAPAIAVGLGIYGTPRDYDYKGQLIETALGDPSSALYNYKFHVNSVRVMAEAQFTWMLNKFIPFINIGIGPARNRLSGYTESPVDSTGYVALPPFQSHTNTNLAYQVGLGVGYAFNFKKCISDYQHERILLGYRYVNLGNASFGTRGVVYPYRLDMDRLTTNEVYLTYIHLF